MKTNICVYVAGPLTCGDVLANTRLAIIAGNNLRNDGYIPFIPHLTVFWDMVFPRSYEDWMSQDFEWLSRCDALYRLPGESGGADREVKLAKKLGIPVFTDYFKLSVWAGDFRRTTKRRPRGRK
jgi:hypothetical protein